MCCVPFQTTWVELGFTSTEVISLDPWKEIMTLFLASTVLITVSPPPYSNLDRGSDVLSWLSYICLSDRKGLDITQWPFRSWMSRFSTLTSRTGQVSVHKTIQFTSDSLVALWIIAKTWWQWWDLATNVSESVRQFQWLSLLLCISFNFWNLFRDHEYLLEVRTCHILNLGNRLHRYKHQGQHDHNWCIISPCSCSWF